MPPYTQKKMRGQTTRPARTGRAVNTPREGESRRGRQDPLRKVRELLEVGTPSLVDTVFSVCCCCCACCLVTLTGHVSLSYLPEVILSRKNHASVLRLFCLCVFFQSSLSLPLFGGEPGTLWHKGNLHKSWAKVSLRPAFTGTPIVQSRSPHEAGAGELL